MSEVLRLLSEPLQLTFMQHAFIAIILAVMANAMAMTARERLAEYATLKTLGFGPRFLNVLVFGESMAIAVSGGILGVAATFPVARLFATQTGTLFPIFEVSGTTVAMQVVAALMVGVSAAYLPARRARGVGILEGLRALG